MATADEIKNLRLQLGEDQTAFANRFNVSRTLIYHWEKHGTPKLGYAKDHVDRIIQQIRQKLVRDSYLRKESSK